MKYLLLVILLVLNMEAFSQTKLLFLKINVLKGEFTVTFAPDKQLLTRVLTKGFQEKGYTILNTETDSVLITPNDEIYFADIFAYQYAADYPSLTLCLRKANQIVYIKNEKKKFAPDRQVVYAHLAQKIMEDFPEEVQLYQTFLPNLEQLIPAHDINIYSNMSNSVMRDYAKQYIVEVSINERDSIDFLIKGGVELYLRYCIDYVGFRRFLKDQPAEIIFEIDKFGYSKILDLKMPENAKNKYKQKIIETFEALPLWVIKREGDKFTGNLKLGVTQ